MASTQSPARRIIVAVGFAAAIAIAPAIALFAGPTSTTIPGAACAPGDVEDPFTFECVPEFVPNPAAAPVVVSPGPPGTIISPTGPIGPTGPTGPTATQPQVGAPGQEEVTACSGRNQGECIERQDYPGATVPGIEQPAQPNASPGASPSPSPSPSPGASPSPSPSPNPRS